MPNMSGWQLIDKIKEKFGDQIPIAIASGGDLQTEEVTKNAKGFKYLYLPKPFTILQLKGLLEKVSYMIEKNK